MEFCPTDEMWADYFTKPLQGSKFLFLRQIIMNEPGVRSVLSPEQLQELQDEEEETGGLNGETAVWVPGRNERSEDPNGGSCLEGLD